MSDITGPKQRVTVLGSTGSVGANTLDVIARHPDLFEVFALSASTRTEEMLAQCIRFRPRFAVMASAPHAILLEEQLARSDVPTRVLTGNDALETIASHDEVDTVMAAIVGAAGLAPCLAAARAAAGSASSTRSSASPESWALTNQDSNAEGGR